MGGLGTIASQALARCYDELSQERDEDAAVEGWDGCDHAAGDGWDAAVGVALD